MLRIRPYMDKDEATVVSWCGDEDTYNKWTFGVLGEYPVTSEQFQKTGTYMRFTAFDEKGPVGFFGARNPEGRAEELRFGFVIVDPEKRNQGIGKAMLRMGLDYAFHIYKAEAVSLGVFESNAPARACYSALGFSLTGIRENYTIGGVNYEAIEMKIAAESGTVAQNGNMAESDIGEGRTWKEDR